MKPPLSLEDQRIITNQESSCRFVDGRYELAVPWKHDRQPLPEELLNTFDTALWRLKNLEIKLQKDSSLAEKYNDLIVRCELNGYIRKVAFNLKAEECHDG